MTYPTKNEEKARLTLDEVLDCLHPEDRTWLKLQLNSIETHNTDFEEQLKYVEEEEDLLVAFAEKDIEVKPWLELISPENASPQALTACIRKHLLSLADSKEEGHE